MFLAEQSELRESKQEGLGVIVAGGVRWVTMSRRAIGRNRANFLKKPIFGAKTEKGTAQDYYSRVDSSK